MRTVGLWSYPDEGEPHCAICGYFWGKVSRPTPYVPGEPCPACRVAGFPCRWPAGHTIAAGHHPHEVDAGAADLEAKCRACGKVVGVCALSGSVVPFPYEWLAAALASAQRHALTCGRALPETPPSFEPAKPSKSAASPPAGAPPPENDHFPSAEPERCPYGGPDTPSTCRLPKGHPGHHRRAGE